MYNYSSTLALNKEHSLYIITSTIVQNHCTPYPKLGADTKYSEAKECRIEEEEEVCIWIENLQVLDLHLCYF